jgi:hypothetical protein
MGRTPSVRRALRGSLYEKTHDGPFVFGRSRISGLGRHSDDTMPDSQPKKTFLLDPSSHRRLTPGFDEMRREGGVVLARGRPGYEVWHVSTPTVEISDDYGIGWATGCSSRSGAWMGVVRIS